MDSPELHALAEAKAKVSLEVQTFRRELDALKAEKESFLKTQETEAMQIVASVMEAAHRLLSEATDTANAVDGYSSTLRDATSALQASREDFRTWCETETERLKALNDECSTKALTMSEQSHALADARMRLETAHRDMALISEQARKDLAAAREERRKLMENKKYMDDTYGGCAARQ